MKKVTTFTDIRIYLYFLDTKVLKRYKINFIDNVYRRDAQRCV